MVANAFVKYLRLIYDFWTQTQYPIYGLASYIFHTLFHDLKSSNIPAEIANFTYFQKSPAPDDQLLIRCIGILTGSFLQIISPGKPRKKLQGDWSQYSLKTSYRLAFLKSKHQLNWTFCIDPDKTVWCFSHIMGTQC